MFDMFVDVLLDAALDTVKLIPFLFLTYLVMEYIEHRTSDRTRAAIRRADRLGPLAGGLLGAFPQCGFSAAAVQLRGRVYAPDEQWDEVLRQKAPGPGARLRG